MKLVEVRGKLWELTPFQDIYEKTDNKNCENINLSLIKDKQFFGGGTLRTYADYKVRSKAKALIQVYDYDFREYNIFFGKGGFYILIKNKKYFLKDIELIEGEENVNKM